MAKVVTRKETGRLVIDFTYRSVRCREQTALQDTPTNRKRVQAVVDKLKKAQLEGTFVYKEFFPGSAIASRFETQETANSVPEKAVEPVAPAQPQTPLFAEFADQWITDHSIEWRRSHTRSVISTVHGRLVPHFGKKVVGGITKSDILAFRANLAKEPGRGNKAGLSSKRINEIMGTMSQILSDAADRFEFTSPMTNVKRLRVKKVDVQPFSLAQVQTLIATARPDFHHYFVVRFFTGMRTGEVHGLKWKYVDFERRQILVRETFVLGEDEYTKTDGSQREIHMSQPVWEALQAQHQVTGRASDYVFCNLLGEPLDNTNFTKRVWYPLLRHLGLEARKPYQMRHTAATLWLASGEAPEWIARQLGHTSTEMLFRVYSRYVPNLTRQDGSAMERLLASQLSQGPLVPVLSSVALTPLDGVSGGDRPDVVKAHRQMPSGGSPAHVITYVPIDQQKPMAQPKPRGIAGGRHRPMGSGQTAASTSKA